MVNDARSHRTGARAASYPRAKLSPGEQRGPVNESAFRYHAQAASSVIMRLFLWRALLLDQSPFNRHTTQSLYDQTWREIDVRTYNAEMHERLNGSVFPGVSP